MNKSIARRLSRRLFWRLLGIFVSLDITIAIIFGVSVAVYCERQAVSEIAFRRIDESSGVIIPEGAFKLPEPIRWIFPEATRDARRVITRHSYAVYSGEGQAVFFNIGAVIDVAQGAFIALAICELITLIDKSVKNSHLIHRSLDPIWELTQAAETLGRVTADAGRPPDMSALEGALERIDASKLDTRIELDATQTELQGLAAAINEMLDRIRAAYSAQIRFVSDASHELRTPIAVIQGYANLLDRWGKNDEKTLQESIDAIRAEAASMTSLVEQLLFLARGDNNTIELSPESFDLFELAEEAARDARLIDTAHEYAVKGAPAVVSADKQLIKQAVRALLDNATKYTDPGGLITLRTDGKDGRAELSVTDTGIGIPDELLPKIFDRFVRADESRARSSGGAGLGLAIAKWIVSRHGGHLEAVSRVGIGTRMTISLKSEEKI
ncbi:MAG: HAMP domain-containing histidine kinase [Oscillospiraceae bacterium]|jgi:signal transduction histidine kinase|nr:HAMP domain-containing histidine kinase [Oscillospiraceae bacterium]